MSLENLKRKVLSDSATLKHYLKISPEFEKAKEVIRKQRGYNA